MATIHIQESLGSEIPSVYRTLITVAVSFVLYGILCSQSPSVKQPPSGAVSFPAGTATDAKECGGCHQAIYREVQYGFGSDMKYPGMVLGSRDEPQMKVAEDLHASSAHAIAGVDPFPYTHAKRKKMAARVTCAATLRRSPFRRLILPRW